MTAETPHALTVFCNEILNHRELYDSHLLDKMVKIVRKAFRSRFQSDQPQPERKAPISNFQYDTDYVQLVSPLRGPKPDGRDDSSLIREGLRRDRSALNNSASRRRSRSILRNRNANRADGLDIKRDTRDMGMVNVGVSTPGRSVKFAEELTTTKLISPTFRTSGKVSSPTRSPPGRSTGGGRGSRSAGEAYVGLPPKSQSDAERYWRKVIVLLLSPGTQHFEMIVVYHDVRERTTITSVLASIPLAATSPRFYGENYGGLVGVGHGPNTGTELVHAISLRGCGIQNNGILLALPSGMPPKELPRWVAMAQALLSDGRVKKLVSKMAKTQPKAPKFFDVALKSFGKQRMRAQRAVKELTGAPVVTQNICILLLVMSYLFFAMPYIPDSWRKLVEDKTSALIVLLPTTRFM